MNFADFKTSIVSTKDKTKDLKIEKKTESNNDKLVDNSKEKTKAQNKVNETETAKEEVNKEELKKEEVKKTEIKDESKTESIKEEKREEPKTVTTQKTTEAPKKTIKNTIVLPDGDKIPFVVSTDPYEGQAYIDNNEYCATTWYTAPYFNPNDGQITYFAAHTDCFRYLLSINIGEVITIYDSNGNATKYRVSALGKMNNDYRDVDGKVVWKQYMNLNPQYGEHVTFQTCINSYWNKIVRAKKI